MAGLKSNTPWLLLLRSEVSLFIKKHLLRFELQVFYKPGSDFDSEIVIKIMMSKRSFPELNSVSEAGLE